MITPKFYFRSRKGDAGTIYVTFYVNREKINFSTRVECETRNWDEKKCCVRASDKDAGDKNIVIESVRMRIVNVFVKYRLKDRKLTRENFMKNYNRPDDYDTFFVYCEAKMRSTRNTLELNTIKMHNSVLAKLKDYQETLHFDDIDSHFLENYKKHLLRDLGNNLNTAYKNMAVIRKYVRMAVRDGYIEVNPFQDFSAGRETPNIVFLDDDELTLLCNIYNLKDYAEKHKSTLQFFLFMCFGSQHVGDARKVKIEQFTETSFTYYRQKMRNRKPEPVIVPISGALRKIIDDVKSGRENGMLFRKLPADQTMNRYLKEIAGNAGINKNINHKTGRHTFATIFLENNPNIKKLQEILGHSDMKTTMVYVHAMEKYKNEGIKCFDKYL